MLGVNYVKAGSVAAVVQCGEAIVWSAEHFYLVALRGGEIAGGYQCTDKQTLTSFKYI